MGNTVFKGHEGMQEQVEHDADAIIVQSEHAKQEQLEFEAEAAVEAKPPAAIKADSKANTDEVGEDIGSTGFRVGEQVKILKARYVGRRGVAVGLDDDKLLVQLQSNATPISLPPAIVTKAPADDTGISNPAAVARGGKRKPAEPPVPDPVDLLVDALGIAPDDANFRSLCMEFPAIAKDKVAMVYASKNKNKLVAAKLLEVHYVRAADSAASKPRHMKKRRTGITVSDTSTVKAQATPAKKPLLDVVGSKSSHMSPLGMDSQGAVPLSQYEPSSSPPSSQESHQTTYAKAESPGNDDVFDMVGSQDPMAIAGNRYLETKQRGASREQQWNRSNSRSHADFSRKMNAGLEVLKTDDDTDEGGLAAIQEEGGNNADDDSSKSLGEIPFSTAFGNELTQLFASASGAASDGSTTVGPATTGIFDEDEDGFLALATDVIDGHNPATASAESTVATSNSLILDDEESLKILLQSFCRRMSDSLKKYGISNRRVSTVIRHAVFASAKLPICADDKEALAREIVQGLIGVRRDSETIAKSKAEAQAANARADALQVDLEEAEANYEATTDALRGELAAAQDELEDANAANGAADETYDIGSIVGKENIIPKPGDKVTVVHEDNGVAYPCKIIRHFIDDGTSLVQFDGDPTEDENVTHPPSDRWETPLRNIQPFDDSLSYSANNEYKPVLPTADPILLGPPGNPAYNSSFRHSSRFVASNPTTGNPSYKTFLWGTSASEKITDPKAIGRQLRGDLPTMDQYKSEFLQDEVLPFKPCFSINEAKVYAQERCFVPEDSEHFHLIVNAIRCPLYSAIDLGMKTTKINGRSLSGTIKLFATYLNSLGQSWEMNVTTVGGFWGNYKARMIRQSAISKLIEYGNASKKSETDIPIVDPDDAFWNGDYEICHLYANALRKFAVDIEWSASELARLRAAGFSVDPEDYTVIENHFAPGKIVLRDMMRNLTATLYSYTDVQPTIDDHILEYDYPNDNPGLLILPTSRREEIAALVPFRRSRKMFNVSEMREYFKNSHSGSGSGEMMNSAYLITLLEEFHEMSICHQRTANGNQDKHAHVGRLTRRDQADGGRKTLEFYRDETWSDPRYQLYASFQHFVYDKLRTSQAYSQGRDRSVTLEEIFRFDDWMEEARRLAAATSPEDKQRRKFK